MAFHIGGVATIPTPRNIGKSKHRETSESEVDGPEGLENVELVSDVRSYVGYLVKYLTFVRRLFRILKSDISTVCLFPNVFSGVGRVRRFVKGPTYSL